MTDLTRTTQGPRPHMPITNVPLSGIGVASFSSALTIKRGDTFLGYMANDKLDPNK